MEPIPYGRQEITENDIAAVVATLKSDYLTQGPAIQQFEEAFAKYIGAKYAIAVANGTAALHLAAMALNVKPGKKVITTPITFAASANCIRYCGGDIVFSDINEDSYLIDLNKVEDILKKEKNIAGVVPVDFAGYPVNLEKLHELANKYNFWILEDACHAPGGYFINSKGDKQFCGSGIYSDLAIFSFHPVKHIATGEGGMITTNKKEFYEKLLLLRTHGITKNPELLTENHGGWYYEMQELGYNYRLTDIQAALGISQLKRADDGLKRRRQISENYNKAFQEIKEINIPKVKKDYFHAYHLYIIQTEKRLELYNFLKKNNIFAQVHYVPLHLHPYYRKLGWKPGDFPIAEKYYQHCLSLPMYHSMTDVQQNFVIDKTIQFLKNNENKTNNVLDR